MAAMRMLVNLVFRSSFSMQTEGTHDVVTPE